MKHGSHGGGSGGDGQLKHSSGAPDFAKETGAPPIVKEHERAHSPNTLDPARGMGKHGGGKRGGNGAKE